MISNETLCCPVCVATSCQRDTSADGDLFMENFSTTCQCMEGNISHMAKLSDFRFLKKFDCGIRVYIGSKSLKLRYAA